MHSSVIPSYNAYNDRHSQVYFRSPRVQAMLRRAEALGKVCVVMDGSVHYSRVVQPHDFYSL